MSLRARRDLIPLALLLALGLPVPARAANGVEDGANLFSRDARLKAEDAIEEIHRHTRKDLLIETLGQLPEAQLNEYRALKETADRTRFFRAVAEERARRADVNGVYVLLCRAPAEGESGRGLARWLPRKWREPLERPVVGHAVVAWPPSNEAVFPQEECDRLDWRFGKIQVGSREPDRNPDQVLLAAVKTVGDELRAKVRGAAPVDTFRWTDVLWAAAVLAATWGALGLVRARVAARQGAPVPGAEQGPAVLLGASGALWLREALRARRGAAATAPLPPTAAEEPPAYGAPHPDDLAALDRAPGPWATEDAEAKTGHDLP